MGLSTTGLKIILICVMFILTITFATLPIKLYRILDRRRQRPSSDNTQPSQWPTIVLSMLTCFSGGIFVSLCFLDILNESIEAFDSLKEQNIWNIDYPIVQLTCLLSFFLIYLVDEVSCKIFTHTHGHSHDHGHSHEAEPEKQENNEDRHFAKTSKATDGVEEGQGSIEDANHLQVQRTDSNSTQITDTNTPEDPGIEEPNKTPQSDINNNITITKNTIQKPPKTIEERRNLVKTMNFLLAIIFHSCFDGIALGVQNSDFSLVSLFFGLGVHKSIEAFSVGLRIIRCHKDRPWFSFLLVIPYAITSPIFAVLGMVITNLNQDVITKNKVTMILLSASMGTFLYIAFFEMLGPEREDGKNGLWKLLASFLGFTIIAVIMIWGG